MSKQLDLFTDGKPEEFNEYQFKAMSNKIKTMDKSTPSYHALKNKMKKMDKLRKGKGWNDFLAR